jgi:hypothetical protein
MDHPENHMDENWGEIHVMETSRYIYPVNDSSGIWEAAHPTMMIKRPTEMSGPHEILLEWVNI